MVDERTVRVVESRTMWPVQYLRQTWQYLFAESKRRFAFSDPDGGDFDVYSCEGWQHFKASGFVFLSFWVEAYLNYALSEKFSNQYTILERAKPIEKLEFVCVEFKMNFCKSKFKDLFDFRNRLAHGKEYSPEDHQEEISLEMFKRSYDNVSMPTNLESRWERYLLTDETKIVGHLEKVLDDLHDGACLKFYATGATDFRLISGTVQG